jgi:hypothetical protein
MSSETFIEKQEESIAQHIFSGSVGMLGVCITVIGIIHIIARLHQVKPLADTIVAFDAILFLITCYMSYTAIKTKNRKLRLTLEKVTDFIFLLALSIIAVICLLFVYYFLR